MTREVASGSVQFVTMGKALRTHWRHVKFAGLATRSRRSYARAIRVFLRRHRELGRKKPVSFEALGASLAQFVSTSYDEGGSHGNVQTLLTAMRRFLPGVRPHLHLAQQWANNWRRDLSRRRALPLPLHVCLGMAGAAAARGHPRFAVILLVGFFGLLRSEELLTLQPRQVIITSPSTAVLLLPKSKGASRQGSPETVMLHDPRVIGMLRVAVESLPHDAPISGDRWPQFQAELERFAALVGLSHPDLTLYSIRRGGATWHYSRYANVDALQGLGRWKHAHTARTYVDEALVARAACSLDPKASQGLVMGRLALQHFLRTPSLLNFE